MQDSADEVNGIIRFAAVLLFGIILLTGIDNGSNESQIKSIVLTFDSNPADGELLQLDNIIFEFDIGDGVVSDHTTVQIDTTLLGTQTNLEAAVIAAGYVV